MSYDLHFFRRQVGMPPAEIYTNLHTEDPGDNDQSELIPVRKIADSLLALGIGLQETAVDFATFAEQMGVTVEEAKGQIDYVELTTETPLQIEVEPTMATLALTYAAYSPETIATLKRFWDSVVPALTDQELVGYDPQLERELTILSFDAIMAAIAEVGDSPVTSVTLLP